MSNIWVAIVVPVSPVVGRTFTFATADASREIRTLNPVGAIDFKSIVYTNSTTEAINRP